ncbi:MAG: tetratricopeptide repeat protein [Betaproteobacteria bacterium]|nr:tetratricopeptide repeat protein [Betaproteobacteria bacterium]
MLELSGSVKASPRWLLHVCAAVFLSVASPAVRADDIQAASQLLRSGQHQQALERIDKVLAAKPRDAQARFLKGLILTEQGNTKEAIVMFQKLTEDYPDLPEPYNNLAVIFAAQGQYDKARSSLEQSIRTHPSYATAYENLGDVYSKLASQAYDKALQLDSANSAAQNKLALVRELVSGTPRGATPNAASKAPTKQAMAATAPIDTKPAPAGATQAKPAAAESSAKTAPKAAAGGGDGVVQMINAWAQAWSRKNVEAYLAFYAQDFKTPNGEPRDEWEKIRRARITAPKSISVSAEMPKVTQSNDTQASVTFRQRYKSDTLSANGLKTLVLVKTGAGWRIQQERVAN